MATTTIPTTLTREQYSAARFAYVRKGGNKGDHWLLSPELPNGCLWLSNDLNGLSHTKDMFDEGKPQIKKENAYVQDEVGCEVLLPMFTFPTGNSLNDLDLEALAQGVIDWI